MTKAKMKIGVIGLGSIGMRHVRNLTDMGHEVYGYDNNPEGKEIPSVGWKPHYAKKLNAIVIASPTDEHSHHINDCMGTPTLVEKPISGAKFMHPSWWNGNLDHIKMVGYNLRFHSCVLIAKDWIGSGALGNLLWANFTLGQYSEKPPYLRDGVILNWSHEIDLALYLIGRGSVACSSTRLSDGQDDLTDILLTHENGCRSTVHLDYITKPEVRQFIIVGSRASIIVDLLNRNAWLRDTNNKLIDSHTGYDDWNDNYIEEMQAFLDRLDGKKTLGCTAEEGLDVLKVCLEVRKQAGL